MPYLAPPSPPDRALARFDENLRRVHFRLWQVLTTVITVAITGWFVTLGFLPAILALMVAKHVLVAILAVGLHLPPVQVDGAAPLRPCEGGGPPI
jgi:hypothetical protein